MAERYTGSDLDEVRMKRPVESDEDASLSKRRHTLRFPVSASGIEPINNLWKHATIRDSAVTCSRNDDSDISFPPSPSSPSQPFPKNLLPSQYPRLDNDETHSLRLSSGARPLADVLDEQKPRARKLSASTSRYSEGSSRESPKESKRECVPSRAQTKPPMLVLGPKFMSRHSSTSGNHLKDNQERVQDSFPADSICAEMVKKLELFGHASHSTGRRVETLRMHASSRAESPTALDALKQCGISGLTLYNASPRFTSHSPTPDSGLGSTHVSTRIWPTVEPSSEEKRPWSPRPRHDLNGQSNELRSHPDRIADVVSDSELTRIFDEVADEELLTLSAAASPTPPRPKSLSVHVASAKPYVGLDTPSAPFSSSDLDAPSAPLSSSDLDAPSAPLSSSDLDTPSAPLSSSDRPVTNTDQPQSSDNEWIAFGEEEELLPRDWDEMESAIDPPAAQDSTYLDPQQVLPEEHADNVPHLPIARPPFPAPVRDRSPIMGVSASNCLRTCFRIGEALNEGCQAARCNKNVILELFANVDSSWRESAGGKQHFLFSDLFHDRSPRIEGIYDRWKENDLWARDSSQFLSAKKGKRLCRCIGQMKREKSVWRITVLNIWEATWDDVEHVRGIACAWCV